MLSNQQFVSINPKWIKVVSIGNWLSWLVLLCLIKFLIPGLPKVVEKTFTKDCLYFFEVYSTLYLMAMTAIHPKLRSKKSWLRLTESCQKYQKLPLNIIQINIELFSEGKRERKNLSFVLNFERKNLYLCNVASLHKLQSITLIQVIFDLRF